MKEADAPKVVTLRVDYHQQTAELKERLLHQLPAVLKYLLPNGVVRRGKFYIGDVQGNRGESMVLELNGTKAGLWHDFATGDGGDILALWAAVKGIDPKTRFPDLMQDVRGWLGVAPQREQTESSRPPQKVRKDQGPVTGRWDYLSATGELLCTVYRFDPPGQRKVYQPWDVVRGKMAWPEAPRPLFNLPGLSGAAQVVLAEGEKTAQALIGAGICATTAMNGAGGIIDKTDWLPLAGKHVLIWPDNDAEGEDYATRVASTIAKAGASKVEILKPPAGRPEKWDGADAVAEGFDVPHFLATAERLVIKEEPKVLPSFSFGDLLDDESPMPADIIAPRLLTPGGLLVFGGAPKVGKSDFLMTMLAHMAAGKPFLGLTPPKPLRVFYLQAEVQYDYLRERVRGLGLPDDALALLRENFFITPQIRLVLNEDGVRRVAEAIRQRFPGQAPDIIAIDPIRNVFDGGPDGAGENDNNAMMFFLQERVEALRQMVNPAAGIILTHHTRKASKRQVDEDPFQSFSGAGSLRSFYTSGMLLLRPDESAPERKLMFELRNGPELSDKAVNKVEGRWQELSVAPTRLVMKEYGSRQDAERDRRQDAIVRLIAEEAAKGRVYNVQQFAEAFDNKFGLGGARSIRVLVETLATQGHIQFFKSAEAYGIIGAGRSRFGYLCVKDMFFRSPEQPLRPSHRRDPATGDLMSVENPFVWQTAREDV